MLLKLFSDKKATTALLTVLLSGVLWLPTFFTAVIIPVDQIEPMPFYAMISNVFSFHIILSKLLAWFFLLFQAYLLVMISGKYMLIENRSFLPALFFLLIVSFYPDLKQFSAAAIGGLFMIISINFFLDIPDKDSFSYRFFESGLILGIGSFFYAKMIFFLPVLWIGAIILRKFDWRELVMAVFGVSLPYLFKMAIDYLRDENPFAIFLRLKENLSLAEIPLQTSFSFWLIIGVLFFMTLLSSIYMLKIFQFRKIFIRNYYLILFWLFIISVLVLVFFSSGDMGILYIISIPLAFLFSNYFYNARKTRGNRFLFVLVLLVFVFNGLNEVIGWV